jgi:hypothetical protein
MAIWPANPWLRRGVIAPVAGLFAALGLFEIDNFLVTRGIPKEGTYLDEILIGVLVAAMSVGLDFYYHIKVTRVRQAAVLMSQLDHHIRNALQAMIFSCSVEGDCVPQDAIRAAVARIEWALAKFPTESEIFAEVKSYLGRNRVEDLKL